MFIRKEKRSSKNETELRKTYLHLGTDISLRHSLQLPTKHRYMVLEALQPFPRLKSLKHRYMVLEALQPGEGL